MLGPAMPSAWSKSTATARTTCLRSRTITDLEAQKLSNETLKLTMQAMQEELSSKGAASGAGGGSAPGGEGLEAQVAELTRRLARTERERDDLQLAISSATLAQTPDFKTQVRAKASPAARGPQAGLNLPSMSSFFGRK